MKSSFASRDPVAVIATVLSAYAFMGSLLSFLGWPLDVPRLTDWFNDGVSIQPNACVLILLSGAACMLVASRAWLAVAALGALVGIGGILILLQYVIGADFGFNHQLLFGRTWGQGTTLTPGRVGPPASVSFALTGSALVLLGAAGLRPELGHLRRYVPIIGLVVCTIMLFSLLGYLFGARQFYTIPWLTAIAFPAASMLLAVGMALIGSVPEYDPLLLLRERSGAGSLARVTIPALMVVIPLVLWLRVAGYEQGFYDLGMGRALGALALIVGSTAIVWVALMALRRREQALKETDRRKDEFLATLAHELRNPLAPLTNAVAILEVSPGDEAVAREMRAMMSRQLKQLARLIDDLLDVSRISRGAMEIRKEVFEIQPLLREAVATMTPICTAAQQELSLKMPAQPVWIEADRVRIAQIVSNLLSNASRYGGAGATIEVDVAREADNIRLRVKDPGTGILQEHLEKIFEMFSQVDTSLERISGGLGIGLYLVRRLVELHGGTVKAVSAGLGKGSEFIVRLPVVVEAPATVRSTERSQSTEPNGFLRVLVVDDNADTASTMAALMRAQGHQTRESRDGLDAIEAAARFGPDVVLLDIGLPKLNGYEACRRIRQQPGGNRIVIVALTGWGQPQDKKRAVESGFDAHLVKPVAWPALADVLNAALEQKARKGEAPASKAGQPV